MAKVRLSDCCCARMTTAFHNRKLSLVCKKCQKPCNERLDNAEPSTTEPPKVEAKQANPLGRWNDNGMAQGEWFKHKHLVEQINRCYDLNPGDRERMLQAHTLLLQLERERDQWKERCENHEQGDVAWQL